MHSALVICYAAAGCKVYRIQQQISHLAQSAWPESPNLHAILQTSNMTQLKMGGRAAVSPCRRLNIMRVSDFNEQFLCSRRHRRRRCNQPSRSQSCRRCTSAAALLSIRDNPWLTCRKWLTANRRAVTRRNLIGYKERMTQWCMSRGRSLEPRGSKNATSASPRRFDTSPWSFPVSMLWSLSYVTISLFITFIFCIYAFKTFKTKLYLFIKQCF